MNYNVNTAIDEWRSAPHAAEAVEMCQPAPIRADIPRGSSGMVCCGWRWEDRAAADAHRDGVHA